VQPAAGMDGRLALDVMFAAELLGRRPG